ncbi:MAG: hypothetical protein HUU47_09315 [Bacteroidetes bacterium]|nr:hypothetical protein [Bacteroidota bacterium]
MNPQELKERTKVLGQTCTKLALVLPQNNIISDYIRKELLQVSIDLPCKARTLLIGQTSSNFVNKLSECSELADKCAYILEFVIDEKLMDDKLVTPLIEECNELILMFYKAFKSVKDKIDN